MSLSNGQFSKSQMADDIAVNSIRAYNILFSRNQSLGLERYDPSDLNSTGLFHGIYSLGNIGAVLAKALKLCELIFPIQLRRFAGCRRTIVPTALYHLGMSFIDRCLLQNNDPVSEERDCLGDVLKRTIASGLRDKEHLCWGPSFPYLGIEKKVFYQDTPCGHYSARLAYFLCRCCRNGTVSDDAVQGYARSAACAILTEFAWREGKVGWTASYFPTTKDEVINVLAEYALVIGEALSQNLIRNDQFQSKEKLDGLLDVICDEQNSSGSWGYYSREYAERKKLRSPVDCHHSAMVVTALFRLLDLGCIDESKRQRLVLAANSGLKFCITQMIDKAEYVLLFPELRREADIAGYCESAIMLAEAQASQLCATDLASRSGELAVRVMRQAIHAFMLPTGDVASARRLGCRINLQSIRWGSGLLMEAISRCALSVDPMTKNDLET